MLGKPVHHIGMVTGDAKFIALRMADNVGFIQAVLLAEVGAKLGGFRI